MKKYRVLTITTPAVAKKLIKLQAQLLDIFLTLERRETEVQVFFLMSKRLSE